MKGENIWGLCENHTWWNK